ncbi:uncharacterized protein LOC128277507 isoform X1 [Anopheles cruzii]|uniref:uncharacterized protein LOC128277507 isoform X1 n=1 Tax=Anopheles cruzii TaxID=68878 RepID=UPI0022EC69E8|nr:uncharacterized protein LOC128277507 isoform X1 [Anopheles cruzii]
MTAVAGPVAVVHTDTKNRTMVHSGALVSHSLLRPSSSAAVVAVPFAPVALLLSSLSGPSSDPLAAVATVPFPLSVASCVCDRPLTLGSANSVSSSSSSWSSIALAYQTSIPVVLKNRSRPSDNSTTQEIENGWRGAPLLRLERSKSDRRASYQRNPTVLRPTTRRSRNVSQVRVSNGFPLILSHTSTNH